MTIKFEFPADRKDIALAISKALAEIAGEDGAIVVRKNTAAGATMSASEVTAATLEDDAPEKGEPSTATQGADGAHGATGTDDGRVDAKGVPFDKDYCANAAKPFYTSGKNKGQWKKRGGENGPTEAEYDAWYRDELIKVTGTASTPANDEPAFDAGQAWKPAAQEAAHEVKQAVPSNPGEFFAWVSEMQTAGHIVQADIDAAYPANNMDPGMLWGADPATQAAMVAALHKTLSAKVGA